MWIEDLTPGLSVTFYVNISGEKLTFDSQILEVYPKRHIVLAEAIYRNDKVITFKGANINVDLLVTLGNDKPQLFRDVTVTLVKKSDGALCYNLTTNSESKPFNRRQSFRCFVGRPTSVRYGVNNIAHETIIRDVSITGFSVVSNEKLEVEPNQVVHVLLTDYFEETAEKHNFHLYGIVARVQELENGKFLYGCRLNSYMPGLEAYIMKKERLRLKKTNGGN